MLQLDFKTFPELFSERLHLRELLESDVKEIYIQRSHPVINQYIKRDLATSEADALTFIRRVKGEEAEHHSVTWAIVPRGHDKLVGQACLWNIKPDQDEAELGYSLHPDWFNQGIMTEALREILSYGVDTMKLKRIDAFTQHDNRASRLLLEKLGFKRNEEYERSYHDQDEMKYNAIYTLLS